MVVNLSAECNFVALGGASRVESRRDEGGKVILYLSRLFAKSEGFLKIMFDSMPHAETRRGIISNIFIIVRPRGFFINKAFFCRR